MEPSRRYRAGCIACADCKGHTVVVLMLAFVFACLTLGLSTRSFGAREQLVIAILAVALSGLYLVWFVGA